ncbi:MAG: hypothetical protein E7376_01935 [Clostridiales bacterium]|nr:hypothetical protein [Clostridiales bacterium]
MEQVNKKNSLPLALVLSALVAVAGAVVWGLIYSSGWFVSIVSYVTALAMFWVYNKFYKISKLTFVWCLVLINIFNIVASFLAIVIAVAAEAGVDFATALDAVISVFGEVSGAFIRDMILGLVFSVLGIASYYSYYKKQAAAKKAVQPAESVVVVDEEAPATEVKQEPENKENPYNEKF